LTWITKKQFNVIFVGKIRKRASVCFKQTELLHVQSIVLENLKDEGE